MLPKTAASQFKNEAKHFGSCHVLQVSGSPRPPLPFAHDKCCVPCTRNHACQSLQMPQMPTDPNDVASVKRFLDKLLKRLREFQTMVQAPACLLVVKRRGAKALGAC